MSRVITRHAQARMDLRRIAEFIGQDDAEAAVRFLDRAEETLKRLADSPEIGTPCRFEADDLGSLHYYRVRQFKRYLLFYYSSDRELALLRVMHTSQDISLAFDEPWPPA
jgi:toxin ParE1/3/4